MERCTDAQQQRRAMKGKMHKKGGTSLKRILLRMRKLVVKSASLEKDDKPDHEKNQVKKTEEETSEGNWTRSATIARTIWKKFNLLLLYEILWKAKGCLYDTRKNAILIFLEYVLAWTSTRWWRIAHMKYMKADNMNHTMWKHQWRRHLEEVCGIYSHLSGPGLELGRRGRGKVGRRSIKRTS